MTRADLTLLILATALLPLLYLAAWSPTTPGRDVRVMAADQAPQTVLLSQARDVSIQGRLGTSTLRIQDGQVRFQDSPCTGKVCIHAGWLVSSGEFAACLPNRVAIRVLGEARPYDAINF